MPEISDDAQLDHDNVLGDPARVGVPVAPAVRMQWTPWHTAAAVALAAGAVAAAVQLGRAYRKDRSFSAPPDWLTRVGAHLASELAKPAFPFFSSLKRN